MLSEQALIQTGKWKEDPKEFQRFGDAIREDLVPIGAIEELSVEDLVGYWWRKRRLLAYESSIMSGQWNTKDQQEHVTVIIDPSTGSHERHV